MDSATVITIVSKNKVLKARAGIKALAPIVQVAFGDGATAVPSDTDNSLVNEIFRKDITSIEQITDTRFRYTCWLETNELENATINEIALIDAEGDFVVIRKTPDKVKGNDEAFAFEIDDIF